MAREATHQVIIDIPTDKAWQIMQDLTAPHKYVPGLLKTEMHGEQRQGVGTSRRVFKKMMALDETVTEWKEGEGFTLRLHDGEKDKPLPKAFFRYSIAPTDDGKTLFTATMGYTFWLGALGQLIDGPIVFPIVKGEIRDVALAVKHYYETGLTPTPADIKRLRQAA
ncbi:MAG: SRPBCC family protein [Pseudomonadales bacterium]|nr:SRPBCC family protein [Pseudomonadales bacterium]